MIANAEYWYSQRADARHKTKGDQNVYTSALVYNGKLYSVVIKNDIPTEFAKKKTQELGLKIGDGRYRDHTLIEIEIAPALSQGSSIHDGAKQGITDAINEVSLGILRGSVKPSKFENGILRQNKRGSVSIMSDTYLVRLFDGADMSTLVHETGHVFFEEMSKLVRNGLADDAMLADYQVMRDWLGARDGQDLTVEQREQAARDFEAYLMEGKAPTRELKSAFSRFKKWLLAIYRRAVNLKAPLTDEVRGVFDRMLATENDPG